MTSLNYIKQIPLLYSQYEGMLNDYLIETWEVINQNIVMGFYKELCMKIPEAKAIQIQTLFNTTIHPNDNKKILLDRLSYINPNKDRIAKLIIILNELWAKLANVWKGVDDKYIPKLSELSKRIYEIDHNNDKLEGIFNIYENIINNYSDMGDIKRSIVAIDDDMIRENVTELYNSTKNILRCNIIVNTQ
jgi:hypothetical protein